MQDALRIRRRRFLGQALAATLLPGAITGARATEPWPARPIRWIVPFLAGTGPDNTARILNLAVAQALGQPVVIENKGGAGGNIGARLAARAEPDGYTWLYSSVVMASSMRIHRNPGYDALKDYRHVMGLTSADTVVIVPPDAGIASFDDLVARMRAAPGKIDYASGGVGTPSHLGVEMMLSEIGASALHVPHKGASEIVNAVVGRHVTFGAPITSVAYASIVSGKLRALAVTGPARNPRLPGVPTLKELGVRGVELTSWGGVSVPAKTPDEIVVRIRKAFESALGQPAVVAALEKQGGQVRPIVGDAYANEFVKEIAFTEAMMKRVGLDPI